MTPNIWTSKAVLTASSVSAQDQVGMDNGGIYLHVQYDK